MDEYEEWGLTVCAGCYEGVESNDIRLAAVRVHFLKEFNGKFPPTRFLAGSNQGAISNHVSFAPSPHHVMKDGYRFIDEALLSVSGNESGVSCSRRLHILGQHSMVHIQCLVRFSTSATSAYHCVVSSHLSLDSLDTNETA